MKLTVRVTVQDGEVQVHDEMVFDGTPETIIIQAQNINGNVVSHMAYDVTNKVIQAVASIIDFSHV